MNLISQKSVSDHMEETDNMRKNNPLLKKPSWELRDHTEYGK
jgi:hypothetical protein